MSTTGAQADPDAAPRPIGVAIATPYLPELESLRGIAMLLVFLFHLDARVRAPFLEHDSRVVSPLLAFVRAGHSGVGLFFILSAFLLSVPFLRQAAGGKRVSVRRYFGRRALRILPLYYVAVLVGTVLSASVPSQLWRGIPYLFFLNALPGVSTPLPPYSSVWWSLATEMQFYLVLPLLPLALTSRAGRRCAMVVLGAWAAAYGVFLMHWFGAQTIPGELALGYSLFGRAPMFLAGIAAAWLYVHHGSALRARLSRNMILRHGGADVVLLAILTALAYVLRWVVLIGPHGYENPPYTAWHLPEVLLWTTVLLLLLVAPLRLKPLLSNPALNRLGVLSYSMYIWHVPVFVGGVRLLSTYWRFSLGWNASTAVVASLLGPLCVALSELTYRLIERPFLIRKERLRA